MHHVFTEPVYLEISDDLVEPEVITPLLVLHAWDDQRFYRHNVQFGDSLGQTRANFLHHVLDACTEIRVAPVAYSDATTGIKIITTSFIFICEISDI